KPEEHHASEEAAAYAPDVITPVLGAQTDFVGAKPIDLINLTPAKEDCGQDRDDDDDPRDDVFHGDLTWPSSSRPTTPWRPAPSPAARRSRPTPSGGASADN